MTYGRIERHGFETAKVEDAEGLPLGAGVGVCGDRLPQGSFCCWFVELCSIYHTHKHAQREGGLLANHTSTFSPDLLLRRRSDQSRGDETRGGELTCGSLLLAKLPNPNPHNTTQHNQTTKSVRQPSIYTHTNPDVA